jgi:predicted RecB family nuclease
MEDAGGAASMLWYSKAIEGDEQMIKKIKEYNYYDTLAQVEI